MGGKSLFWKHPFSFLLFDNVEVNLHVNVDVGVASGVILVLTNMLSGRWKESLHSGQL